LGIVYSEANVNITIVIYSHSTIITGGQNVGMSVNYRGKKVLYHRQLEAAQPPAVKEMMFA
jgi:hypothetical protein